MSHLPWIWIVPAAFAYAVIGVAFDALAGFDDDRDWKCVLLWPIIPAVVIWMYLADWFCEGRDWLRSKLD